MTMAGGYKYFEAVEKHAGLLGILTAIMVSIGGLAEITLFMAAHTVKPADGVKPYDALRLAGKDIYVREGCYLCHSQMVRALRAETERYGPYSVAEESVYDRPFQWGSKRTGPDLARVGGKYSDEWQRQHLRDPRAVVPESNMPSYAWLSQACSTAPTSKHACARCACSAIPTATPTSPVHAPPSPAAPKWKR
jgi:cytochrome c oxidase cbb3-type subunit 2